MTARQLALRIRRIARDYARDPEVAHAEADKALIEYINSPAVKSAYDSLTRWYA